MSSPSSKCGEGPGPYKTLCPPPKGAEMAEGGANKQTIQLRFGSTFIGPKA